MLRKEPHRIALPVNGLHPMGLASPVLLIAIIALLLLIFTVLGRTLVVAQSRACIGQQGKDKPLPNRRQVKEGKRRAERKQEEG